jgi:hypothetical protein
MNEQKTKVLLKKLKILSYLNEASPEEMCEVIKYYTHHDIVIKQKDNVLLHHGVTFHDKLIEIIKVDGSKAVFCLDPEQYKIVTKEELKCCNLTFNDKLKEMVLEYNEIVLSFIFYFHLEYDAIKHLLSIYS